MAGYLNQNTLNSISAGLVKMHDTFSRKIQVYKHAEKTVIATNANYNAIYGRTNAGSKGGVSYKMVMQEFDARVYYIEQTQEYLAKEGHDSSSQNKIILPKGSIKIVVTLDGHNFLKEAKRVDVDGKTFLIKSGGSSSGFPSNEFYRFFLTPTED